MKKTALLYSLVLLSLDGRADETDWLNFSTGSDGSVVESVLFRSHGRLTFGETAMMYEDDGGRRTIPYSGGAYIFFSAEAPTGVEDVRREDGLSLVYLAESQQIAVRGGADAASRIRLISPQGSILRAASNSQTISTAGLSSGILIATAACGGKTITRKFIIK